MSKSPSLRRIQADIRELAIDPSDRYHAAPLEDDMFEWHFTIRGADGTDFEGGIYHGRILLPTEYPFKPPHIVFLTPSGRFETGVKVCLSFSAHHPELWQPAWGIRLILEALISFLPTPADGAIGSLDWTGEERKRLAKKSLGFCCSKCGHVADLLPALGSLKKDGDGTKKSRFHEDIAKLHMYQQINEQGNNDKGKAEDGQGSATAGAAKEEEHAVAAPDKVSDADVKDGEETPPDSSEPASEEANDDVAAVSSEKKEDGEAMVADRGQPSTGGVADDDGPAPKIPPSSSDRTTGDEVDDDKTKAPAPSQQPSGLVQAGVSAAAVAEQSTNEEAVVPSSSFSDPTVHAILVTIVAIIVLLYRKVQALLIELAEVED